MNPLEICQPGFPDRTLPDFPILYSRDNHTDQLCRALWGLLVTWLQNGWLFLSLWPGDSHSYRVLGLHLWAVSGNPHSFRVLVVGTLCSDNQLITFQTFFEKKQNIKIKWECSKEAEFRPCCGERLRGSGQPWLMPSCCWSRSVLKNAGLTIVCTREREHSTTDGDVLAEGRDIPSFWGCCVGEWQARTRKY